MNTKFSEIELAVEFASSAVGDNEAYISLDTGKIYWISDSHPSDDLPEDFWDSGRYLMVPQKNDLDLGSSLVHEFAAEHAPHLRQQVRELFRRRGAYGRFKTLLDKNGILEKWHTYENNRETTAIEDWCRENGIELTGNEDT